MKQSVIDKLRNMTVANGCTPEEAETARKKLAQILAARPNTRKVNGKTVRLFSVKIDPDSLYYYHAPSSTRFETFAEMAQAFKEAMREESENKYPNK